MNHRYLVPALFSLAACTAVGDSDVELAEESVDSAISGQSEAAIVATLADGATAATTTEAAAKIAANANLQPAGCATVATSGATTTVTIAGCSGARGLVNVSGTITVKITAATASSLSLTATSSDLQIDGASLDLAVDATYGTSGGASSLVVTSSSSGVGARGHAIVHMGAYTATWDANCATVDGSWATANETARRSLDVSLSRCRTSCPTGSVTRTRLDGSTIAIAFDGTPTASWSSSRRGAGTVSLGCTP